MRFTVINETPGEVQLLWINDETREEVSYTNIRAGQRATQQTFPGHEWHCRTVDGGVTLVECKVHTDLSICIGQPVASSRAPAETEAASASTTDGFYHHCVRIASIPVRAHSAPRAARNARRRSSGWRAVNSRARRAHSGAPRRSRSPARRR